MKNYLFYDEETGEYFFVQDESLWEANKIALPQMKGVINHVCYC